MASIHVRNPYEKDAYTYYPVVIVGAGASGIAMGCRLREKLKFDQFRIFDRQSGVGGTWWINRYPGVACDVPTALYSFSFAPNYTSPQVYPSGKDYVTYLYNVAEQYRLLDKIQLNTDVTEIRWVEEDSEWEVKLSHLLPGMGDLSASERQKRAGPISIHMENIRARVVISCVGILVEPNAWPGSIPGNDIFQGEIIHSARWRDDIDLKYRDVIVIGSGCSAAQIVPSLLNQTDVKSITQIMRTPPWTIPRVDEPFGREAYARHAPTVFHYFPLLGYSLRCFISLVAEILWFTIFQRKNVRLRRKAEQSSLDHMRSKVPKKYHEIMIPTYDLGCKRRVFDSEWMESMHNPKFTLTVLPLKRLNAGNVSLGREKADSVLQPSPSDKEVDIPADVIILATGFEATRFLHPLSVYGRQGQSIHSIWSQRGGPQAYMGTALDSFPNFFMMVGPNTFVGHSSVILGIESTVRYILKLIKPVLVGEAVTVEPKREAAIKWTADVQSDMQKTVFAGCRSWYVGEGGWNSTMYPRSQLDFALRCLFPRYTDWTITYTPKALLRRRIKKVLGFASLIVFLAGLWRKRDLTMLWREAALRVLGALDAGVGWLKMRVVG